MSISAYNPGMVVSDRYELAEKLGSTGYVFKAHDRNLDKTVAIKFLEPKAGAQEVEPWAEAQRLEHLSSRFLARVINADVDTASDIRYIVTELLEHGDLEAAARPMGLAVSVAVRMIQQAATGLDRIHAERMVHRDIKPANLLLDADNVLITDLEFCELLDTSGRAGRNGTWETLAPEALSDQGYCSIAGDVYSLGATAYFLLTGRYPVTFDRAHYDQAHVDQFCQRVSSGQRTDLKELAPHVPQAVRSVIHRAISVDPNDRYSSALEFSNALVHAARNQRDWLRVDHAGHEYCVESDQFEGRGPFRVCAVRDAGRVRVEARRLTSGHRVAGVDDQTATASQVMTGVRRAVKACR